MQTTELHYLTIAEAAPLIAAKRLSPVELTRAHLERIERTDDRLNSFITLLADNALADARRAESAILAGDCRGPLHGIPIALKDLYYTKGIRTTMGSRIMNDFVPNYDAAVVERFRDAGDGAARQASDARIRARRNQPKPASRPGAQPMGHRAHHRRLQRRLRLRGGRRAVHGRARQRHRRLHPNTLSAVRHRGPQSPPSAG